MPSRASRVVPLLDAEETERCRRSLERRIHLAALGPFKPIADFDWKHPRKIDRAAIEGLFDASRVRRLVRCGPRVRP